MKVYVYGNNLNCGFDMTKQLRAKGIDAEVFIDRSSNLDQDYPWWDDKTLSPDNLPSWVHYYPVFPNLVLPNRETKQMIRDFAKCDVALVSCYGPIVAMKAKVPFVFYSVGGDLNMIDLVDDLKSFFFNTYPLVLRLKKLIKIFTFGRMQRKALKSHASRILLLMGYQYRKYIVGQNLQDKTVKLTFPRDIVNYKADRDEQLNAQFASYDHVFLMASRQSWKSVWNDSKGNDKFIRAFARYAKEKKPNVLLMMLEKGIDLAASKALVKDLGIAEYVHWIGEMPRYLLKKYQSMPNVVMLDGFWHDRWYDRFYEDREGVKAGFGLVAIETLSSKSLLITAFTDQEYYGGETPPILIAFTEDEIYQRLLQLSQMTSEEKDQMRQAGYDFIYKWHEQDHRINTFITPLEEVYDESSKLLRPQSS